MHFLTKKHLSRRTVLRNSISDVLLPEMVAELFNRPVVASAVRSSL